jgi:PAS domain S-box-containing protein
VEDFRSGDALFTCNGELEIVQWNQAAEELTGISSTEAVGRRCWHVLCGVGDTGQTICHAGCTSARLARERWPVACQHLLIKTRDGKRRVTMSTVTAEQEGKSVIVHIMHRAPAETKPKSEVCSDSGRPLLTPRQQEVLSHLAQGRPAKRIASRLGITEATTRNHIRAILLELGCHSQLEAVATARRLELI